MQTNPRTDQRSVGKQKSHLGHGHWRKAADDGISGEVLPPDYRAPVAMEAPFGCSEVDNYSERLHQMRGRASRRRIHHMMLLD